VAGPEYREHGGTPSSDRLVQVCGLVQTGVRDPFSLVDACGTVERPCRIGKISFEREASCSPSLEGIAIVHVTHQRAWSGTTVRFRFPQVLACGGEILRTPRI
jgi:hypothetical protein